MTEENINKIDSKGEVQVNHNWFLDYIKDENGHLIIEPTQAKAVKRIYQEYLERQACFKSDGDWRQTASSQVQEKQSRDREH